MSELENISDVDSEQPTEQPAEQTTEQPAEQPTEQQISAASEETEPEVVLPQKPRIIIKASTDGSRAEIELQRVAMETLNPTREDIEEALAENNIVYGIDEKFLDHLTKQPAFNVPMDIAVGTPEKTGDDGYLKYLVETKRELKPKIRKDGSINYFDLGFVHNVEKGEPLCEVHFATKGDDGTNIFGVTLEGKFGRDPDIPIGQNTEFDKETNLVVASLAGNVVVNPKGIIDVQDTVRVSGNIDNSTGNISFVGDVFISGDVMSGFKVESKGSIHVKGTVEGAQLTAEKDITVERGINGMNRARIVAGGDLKSKYIQNTNIETGGNISADGIMHCIIECNGSVELSGKQGALIGGKSVIAQMLVAKTLGTEAHVATFINMAGSGIAHSKTITKLKKELSVIETEIITMQQTLVWCADLIKKGVALKPFQINAFEKSKLNLSTRAKDREDKMLEIEEVQKLLNDIDPMTCFIKCSGRVHTGVKITFGMQTMNVQASFMNSRVMLIEGEITISPM